MQFVQTLWRRHLLGIALWVIAFAVVFVIFARDPDLRSVTLSYRFGSQMFLERQQVYNLDLLSGYLYAPAFAVVFAPFYLLGPLVGDGLWRILCFGVLTYAAIRQARRIDGGNQLFLLSTGLAIAVPISLGALRNGQSTILLAGACWLLVLSALERKTAQTVLWAIVAVLAKPIAIVVLLLVGAIRLRLVPALMLSLAIVLALPYGFAPAAYVTELYRNFWTLLFSMSVQSSAHFARADFTAPLLALGVDVSANASAAIRFVFALITLGAVVWIDRNAKPNLAGLAIVVVAVFYMSVFNPRVEANTYSLLAAPFGLAIAAMILHEPRVRVPVVLAAVLFLAGLTGISRGVSGIAGHWFRPMVCTVLFCAMAAWIVTRMFAKAGRGLRQHDAAPIAHG